MLLAGSDICLSSCLSAPRELPAVTAGPYLIRGGIMVGMGKLPKDLFDQYPYLLFTDVKKNIMTNNITPKYLLSCLCIVLASCSIHITDAYSHPDYWPTKGWRTSTPEEQGIDSKPLIEMLERIIAEGVDVDSISIIRNGYLVADVFMFPADKEKTHPVYSCAKSLTSTLIGIAVDKGYIESTQDHMVDFFPQRSVKNMDDRKKAITLHDLLTMRSGLKTEDNINHGRKGLNEMRTTSGDWTQYVLDRPMEEMPGTRFEYSNLVSFLLTSILQKQTDSDALSFAFQHLFEPLGIKNVEWYKSPKGIYTGFAELSMTPHDMAKLGLLYLEKGRWENRQILSEEWIEVATNGHVSVSETLQYGYQWWVADNLYFAMGHQGQFLFVEPDRKMIVVFTSSLLGQSLFTPYKYLIEYILPAAHSTTPLPANIKDYERLKELTDDLFRLYYHNIEIAQ